MSSASLLPGDRVLFQGGAAFPGTLKIRQQHRGTPQAPVAFSSYGTGRATIYGGAASGIDVYNVSGIEISNLNVKGSGSKLNTANGIRIHTDLPGSVKLPYVRLTDLEVSGFGLDGVAIVAWPVDKGSTGYKDFRMLRLNVHDNGQSGILSKGYWPLPGTLYAHEDIYVGFCKSYRNTGVAGKNNGNGIIIGQVNRATIERNTAYENGTIGGATTAGPVGIWAWDSNQVTIQYNESYSNHSASGVDGGGFDLDGGMRNSVVQYNYSHDNDGAGILFAQFGGSRAWFNNVVRYNISQNDGRKSGYGGLDVWTSSTMFANPVRDAKIHNNVFYMSPSATGSPSAVRFQTISKNLHFANNVFMTTGGMRVISAPSAQSGVQFTGNAYHSMSGPVAIHWAGKSYSGLSQWRGATAQETYLGSQVGIEANPQFVAAGQGGKFADATQLSQLGAYRLVSSSPLIGAGLDLASRFGFSAGGRDFYGTSLPQGGTYEIGAHELPGVSTVAPGTVLFQDNFESGSASAWQPVSGSWVVCQPPGVSKEYCQNGTGTYLTAAGSTQWTNYSVQAIVYSTSTSANTSKAVLGRMRSASEFYQLELKRNSSGSPVWALYKNLLGKWTQLAGGSYSHVAGKYYVLRMTFKGTQITAEVSSDLGATFRALGTTSDSSIASGRIGLRTWGAPARFDAVKVIAK